MRLVDRDAYAVHLRAARQYRIGDRAGGGFDEAIAPPAEGFRHRHDHQVVGNGILQLVGARCSTEFEFNSEIDMERLSDLGLMLHHAVVGMKSEPLKKDRVAHRARPIAAATASACTVGATSWARTMLAPLSTARRCAASDPPRRSMGSDGATE